MLQNFPSLIFGPRVISLKMILGHFSASFVAAKFVKKDASTLQMACAIVGGYFPDLIDKPMSLLGLGMARGFGHSGLLLFGLLLLASLIKNPLLWMFVLGNIIHLMTDFVDPAVFLWPALGPFPTPVQLALPDLLGIYYFHFGRPEMLMVELLFHFLLIVYLLRRFKGGTYAH